MSESLQPLLSSSAPLEAHPKTLAEEGAWRGAKGQGTPGLAPCPQPQTPQSSPANPQRVPLNPGAFAGSQGVLCSLLPVGTPDFPVSPRPTHIPLRPDGVRWPPPSHLPHARHVPCPWRSHPDPRPGPLSLPCRSRGGSGHGDSPSSLDPPSHVVNPWLSLELTELQVWAWRPLAIAAPPCPRLPHWVGRHQETRVPRQDHWPWTLSPRAT